MQKKKNEFKKDISLTLKITLDYISLVAVMQYVIFRFLQSTTFPFVYSTPYKVIVFLSLVLSGSARFLIILRAKIKASDLANSKKIILSRCFFFATLALPFVYVGWKHDVKILIFMPITALCLYDMEPERVLKSFVTVVSVLLIATIICSLTGSIRNIAVIDYMEDYSYKASYGIVNTTDFASYCLFILLFLWCGREKKKDPPIIWISLVALIAIGTYYLSGSRTTLVCCAMIGFACIWEWIEKKIREQRKRELLLRSTNKVLVASLPLMILLLAIAIALYSVGYDWMVEIDKLFSGRIRFAQEAILKNGISVFGRVFEMHGNGGTIFLSGDKYNFLDGSYIYILIRYGLGISIIIVTLWIWMMIRAIRGGKRRIAFIMTIMAIYALSESHLQEINYNILISMPFCAFETDATETESSIIKEKRSRYRRSIISVLAIGVCCISLLPVFLSQARTIVYLEKWNSGVQTVWPLLLFSIIPLALYWFWKSLFLVWCEKKKKALISLGCLILLFGSGLLYSNHIIQTGITKEKDDINNNEAETIKMIQSSASQPVYAFEKAGLYKSIIGGFSETIMLPEDLCRKKQGTYVVSKDKEVLPLTICGAKYLQFSPQSGVYTFDPEVIKAMQDIGYEFKTFYDSERYCDLADLAYLNNLQTNEDGAIELYGKTKSLHDGRFIDQEIGTYNVIVSLSIELEDAKEDREICTVYVTGYKGDEIILEKEIMSSAFDEKGHLNLSLNYFIPTTPKVEYKIVAHNNERVCVENIRWQRIAKGMPK